MSAATEVKSTELLTVRIAEEEVRMLDEMHAWKNGGHRHGKGHIVGSAIRREYAAYQRMRSAYEDSQDEPE